MGPVWTLPVTAAKRVGARGLAAEGPALPPFTTSEPSSDTAVVLGRRWPRGLAGLPYTVPEHIHQPPRVPSEGGLVSRACFPMGRSSVSC